MQIETGAGHALKPTAATGCSRNVPHTHNNNDKNNNNMPPTQKVATVAVKTQTEINI